jgi:hypothetical protein
MIGQSIPHLRFPSSKKWDCEFKERWEINQLKSWRDEENRENIEVGIYRGTTVPIYLFNQCIY